MESNKGSFVAQMTQKKIPCKSSNGSVDFLFSFLPVTQKKCLSMPRARVLYLTSLPANDMSFTLLITIYTSFTPILGKIPILTNIFFQMGWFNHQPALLCMSYLYLGSCLGGIISPGFLQPSEVGYNK